MKLKRGSKGKFVGLSSFVMAFALLGTAVLCPFSGECAEAASSQRLKIDFVVREALSSKRLTIDFFLTKSGDISYENIAKTLGIDFVINEKINLGIAGLSPEADAGTVTPLVGGKAFVKSTGFTAGTNNENGLVVQVSGDETMALMNSDGSFVDKAQMGASSLIQPTAAVVDKVADLSNNTWGYNLSESKNITDNEQLELSPMKSTGTQQTFKDANGGAQNLNLVLTFGARVDTGVMAGTYGSRVYVDVAASAENLTSRADTLRQIEDAINNYKLENPEFAAELDKAQAKARAKYDAEQRGEVWVDPDMEEAEIVEQ